MKNSLILIVLVFSLFSCKKDKKTESPSEPQTPTPTMPESPYKRVKLNVTSDSATGKTTTTSYEYDLTTGYLFKETIKVESGATSDVTTRFYYYNSIKKVDSTVTTLPNQTKNIYKYIYKANELLESGFGSPAKTELLFSDHYFSSNGKFVKVSHAGASWDELYYYVNGDIDKWERESLSFTGLVAQWNYDALLLDKSKLFFNETAPIKGGCKLLKSIYTPVSPYYYQANTVTYSYKFDSDGYPISYKSSDGTTVTITYL